MDIWSKGWKANKEGTPSDMLGAELGVEIGSLDYFTALDGFNAAERDRYQLGPAE